MFKDLPEGQTHSFEDDCGHEMLQETVSYRNPTEEDCIDEIITKQDNGTKE